MKTARFFFRVGTVASLIFCFSHAQAAVVTTQPQVKISIVIHGESLQDWENMRGSAPNQVSQIKFDATGKTDESFMAESIREYPYVAKFNGPQRVPIQSSDGTNRSAIISMTPAEFKTEHVGWQIALTPSMDNGLVKIQANATYTTPDLHPDRGVYGENTGPIYADVKNPKTGKIVHAMICANAATLPSFQKSETPFYVFAKPGKEYQIKLQCGSDWVNATIKCELL